VPKFYGISDPDPRFAAMGTYWIKVAGITADSDEHVIDAEPGDVITAEGVFTSPDGKVIHRNWSLRVTGNNRRDNATLTLGSLTDNCFVDVAGVTLESA
jgi:hypothetical protein